MMGAALFTLRSYRFAALPALLLCGSDNSVACADECVMSYYATSCCAAEGCLLASTVTGLLSCCCTARSDWFCG